MLYLEGWNARKYNEFYRKTQLVCWLLIPHTKKILNPSDLLGNKEGSKQTNKMNRIADIKKKRAEAKRIFESEVKGNTELDKIFGD